MGLGDIYGRVPDSFAGRNEQQMGQAFGALPVLYDSYLRDKSLEQSNVDRAYNSPARPANPQEMDIGNYVRKMMGYDDPNVPPGWADRLKQELSGGEMGLSQPGRSMGPGPMEPEGTNVGLSMRSNTEIRGEPLSGPGGLGGEAIPSPDYAVSMPQSRPQPAAPRPPRPGMTQGDVDKYMRMAGPSMKATGRPQQDRLEEIWLRSQLKGIEDRKTVAVKGTEQRVGQTQAEGVKVAEGDKDRALAWEIALLKDKQALASIEARVRIGTGTAMDVAKLKALVSIYGSAKSAGARELSSIPNIAENERLITDAADVAQTAKQALIDIEKVMKSPQPPAGKQSMSVGVRTRQPQGESNRAALKWLRANPDHPDAPAVRKKLGISP